jgi:hypothetical protein
MSAHSEFAFASVGLWVPCDQAAFISHDGDKHLRTPYELRDVGQIGVSAGQDSSSAYDPALEDDPAIRLDATVLRRLAVVLYKKGYTYVFPVFHLARNHGEDPDAAIFVHPTFSNTSYEPPTERAEKYALPPGVTLHGLALLVNSSGYYLWLTQYIPHDKTEAEREQVEMFLRDYVYFLVGGDFSSHYSGLEGEKDELSEDDQYEQGTNLLTYRDNCTGIFTFTQLNIILEGLYNSTLDFQVFFYGTTGEQKDRVRKVKGDYCVGNFARLITARVRGDLYAGAIGAGDERPDQLMLTDLAPGQPQDELPSQEKSRLQQAIDLLVQFGALAPLLALGSSGESQRATQAPFEEKDLAQQIFDSFLPPPVCEYLLRKFLQATASSVLQDYKRRIERCRRALLAEMVQVTHRQQPLLQVEAPDRRPDRIEGVNEAQLRGYVMLLSAKLPLLENVKLYLKEIAAEHHYFDHDLMERDRPASSALTPGDDDPLRVSAALTLWMTLFEALSNDLRGLERAVEQARRDRLVQEEEQIRVEQETIAEIERLQERTAKSLSPTTTLTLGLLSNAFALASVVVAVIGIASRPQGITAPNPLDLTTGNVVRFLAEVLGLGLLLGALYFVAHYGFSFVLGAGARLLRLRLGERYYYEIDLHMDAPLGAEEGHKLLMGQVEALGWDTGFITDVESTIKYRKLAATVTQGIRFWNRLFWPTFRRVERNSYRAERQTAEEAMHKVYLDVTVVLRRIHWYHPLRPAIRLVLVYEILYHRPARAQRYILKDLRVIATSGKILKLDQLAQIKAIIADNFVNRQISGAELIWRIRTRSEMKDGRELHHDSLFSLTAEANEGEQPARPLRWREVWSRRFSWLLRRVAWLLRQVGILGLGLYLARIVRNVLILASSGGLNTHVDGALVLRAFTFDELIALPRFVLFAPAAGAVILALAVRCMAGVGRWLRSYIVAALLKKEVPDITRHPLPGNGAGRAMNDSDSLQRGSDPIVSNRYLIGRLARSIIRCVWGLTGLVGWVAQQAARPIGALLASIFWSLMIVLGALAVLNFLLWAGVL